MLMKKIGVYLVLFLALSLTFNAQTNLVPNYSFEEKDSCPKGMSYLTPSCKDWYTPISKMNTIPIGFSLNSWGTSDYFNLCANNTDAHIPNNYSGFQTPNFGNAYSGILLTINIPPSIFDFKEYIEVKLLKKLMNNKEYCIEFYYSIAERYNYSKYYPIGIGALLTDTIVSRQPGINTQQPQNIYAIPQVSGKLPQVMDTLNWIKVSGSFIAKGGEQYLTIGNFQHTDTLTNKSVYVYIDDVKLYYCGPDTTPQPVDSLVIPNVFTPNGDGYNDKFVYKNQEQWEFETQVFSRWGNLVYDNKTSENWDGTFQGERVSSGVYFYKIKAKAIKTGEMRVFRGTVSVFN